ncbi:putative gag-polypeptide of LTR copia-type [Lupinus albus]|uniref:Putative gag-polypeptide of LTR copia-type n=1 Tax=Lupinus albus TaxID=3870 RepID=A0A6A4PEG4_LUPAL|nr:putative gag-polypeptide of LTR copia-type [Lupinus albus]
MVNQRISLVQYTNPSNPYFLHSNNNFALILVTCLLNGRNYHYWARAMTLALWSKTKLKFIQKKV